MIKAFIAIASSLAAVVLILWGLYVFYRCRFLRRLRAHAAFSGTPHSRKWEVSFTHTQADDDDLTELRETHRLDDLAGVGSDQERAIRLLYWVNGLSRHAVHPTAPKDLSALNLIRLCQQQGKRINCWMYSIILHECLLSIGIPARMVHLSPPTEAPKESHFVVVAYLGNEKKWIMLDPDMRSYFEDEKGSILGVAEVRQRLATGEPLEISSALNLQGANGLPLRLRKALYRTYISKNIFRIACPQRSAVRKRSDASPRTTYELIPDGYHPEWLKQPRISTNGNAVVYINDQDLFWQAPATESG